MQKTMFRDPSSFFNQFLMHHAYLTRWPAKTYKADMIVIGSRGMGDVKGMLRGGVSHRVEMMAECPVLVV